MPKNGENNLAPFVFQGAFQPETLNEEKRTVQIKWYTGAKVDRYSWSQGKYFLQLSMDPSHVKLDRLKSGKSPFLNAHSSYSLGSVLGVIEDVRIEAGVGYGTVRFSNRKDVEGIFQDVKDGILGNVSVGAQINKLEKIDEDENEVKTYLATDWEPLEVSLVPIGADPNAQTFSHENEGEDPLAKLFEGGHISMAEKPKDQEANPVVTPEPKQEALTAEQLASATKAERERVQEITRLGKLYGMDEKFANTHIESGASLAKVKELILEELAAKAPDVSGVSVGATENDKQREALQDALSHKINPSHKLKEERSPYRGQPLVGMAREYLGRQGVNVQGLSPHEIAELSLSGRTGLAYHTTSDFPLILADSINRRLRDTYMEALPTWQPFCSRATAPNFKKMKVVALGAVSSFKKVGESGEYQYGTMGESGEEYAVEKSGIIIALTYEAMVNDDLSAFDRIPRGLTAAARRQESNTIYDILMGNPTMADGEQLFSAAHGNIAATGSVITDAALDAARQAMRTQKDGDNVYLNITPEYLIVGPTLEGAARKMITREVVPGKTSDVNIWAAAFNLIVDPRITDKKWFLAASPAQIDTIEYAYLAGEEGMSTTMRSGFEVDGLEIKVRHVFGAAPIDYRGLYYNPGA